MNRYWILVYEQGGETKRYRFGAPNYFIASVRGMAYLAFKGDISHVSIIEDYSTFSEN